MEFHVEGMTCAHCVRAVTKAIQGIDPQAQVEVDLPAKRVRVQGEVDAERALAAIADAGYTPTLRPSAAD